MTLARQNVLLSLGVALPAALLLHAGVLGMQASAQQTQLARIAESFMSEIVRQTCESDPQWFLAGPRTGRPRPEERLLPDADVRLPRPSAEELPFEFFAFDEGFVPASVAGPRFPETFKRAMRASVSERQVSGEYASATGTGLQVARFTGWSPGPCAYLLFRQQPVPRQWLRRAVLFTSLYGVSFLVALAAAWPVAARVRKLSKAALESVRKEYTEMVPVKGQDEISSLGSVFNDAAADIRLRIADAQDREETLRRYVANTTDDVAQPMAALATTLAALAKRDGAELRDSMREAHRLSMRLENLAAVTRLRGITEGSPREPVDLVLAIDDVLASRAELAESCGVTLEKTTPVGGVTIQADGPLIRQAIANLVDNAIVYNRPGGRVHVDLKSYEHGGRFSLVVADNGPGVSDEEFAGLTAKKRFRGDEAKTRRPGERGLGLALTREVADRFGLALDLRRPSQGGFEAGLAPRGSVA